MGAKILILDDEKQIIKVFSLLMEQYNYDVDSFEDPEKALGAVTSNPSLYDAVISDIRMPKMDGVEFAKKIRSVSPSLPIILMTGYMKDDLKDEVAKLQKVVLLQKPFPLKETLETLLPKLLGERAKS